MRFQDKIAIVTGGGSGMGKEVATRFVAEGGSVVINGRNGPKAEAAAHEIDPTGTRVTVYVGDISLPATGEALVKTALDRFGRLDVLFNNAGIGAPAMPMEDLPLETWKKVVDTNLTGLFLCTQEAIRLMKAQEPRGGRIINNGSISAHTPRPRAVAYTATKHAVTGLTKQTALDCRGEDICCSQIDIGNAATPLTERMVHGQGVLQPDGRSMIEPRMNADDVGRAVVFMASLPLDTNVLFMTVMATQMPFVGRG